MEELRSLPRSRGAPVALSQDNGTEFTSKHYDAWAFAAGIQLDFIRPGDRSKLDQNFRLLPGRRMEVCMAQQLVRFLSIALLICVVSCAQEPFLEEEGLSLKVSPPDLDKVTGSVADLAEEIAQCRSVAAAPLEPGAGDETRTEANQDKTTEGEEGCVLAVYVWSGVMPLSWVGIENVTAATEDLGVHLALIDGEGLWDELDERGPETATEDAGRTLASELIGAGATVHYPALLLFDGESILEPPILGFKTETAYRAMIAERLDRGAGSKTEGTERTASPDFKTASAHGDYRDIEIDGHPGAYFRHIPRTDTVGLEIKEQNYTLDLAVGERYWAPGIVDLVPTPDGLFLVTPRTARGGLEFHTVADMFARRIPVALAPGPPTFEPFYVDLEMVDQYPSVGILEREEGSVTYRVLTSWFDGILHRDYEVRYSSDDGRAEVEPLGKPVHTCPDFQLSIPIMAKDGREVAARDEAAGTTKIFRINDDSSCDVVLDTGMQTGKVAWDSTGRRIAFAIPRGVARDSLGNVRTLHGVFVLDRENLSLMRVPGSTAVDRLTFPEFVEDTTVIFVIRGERETGARDRFRLFCCLK